MCHWYDHLSFVFILSLQLEDVLQHIEPLTIYMNWALNLTLADLSVEWRSKINQATHLPIWMALDIVTATQGDIHAILTI